MAFKLSKSSIHRAWFSDRASVPFRFLLPSQAVRQRLLERVNYLGAEDRYNDGAERSVIRDIVTTPGGVFSEYFARQEVSDVQIREQQLDCLSALRLQEEMLLGERHDFDENDILARSAEFQANRAALRETRSACVRLAERRSADEVEATVGMVSQIRELRDRPVEDGQEVEELIAWRYLQALKATFVSQVSLLGFSRNQWSWAHFGDDGLEFNYEFSFYDRDVQLSIFDGVVAQGLLPRQITFSLIAALGGAAIGAFSVMPYVGTTSTDTWATPLLMSIIGAGFAGATTAMALFSYNSMAADVGVSPQAEWGLGYFREFARLLEEQAKFVTDERVLVAARDEVAEATSGGAASEDVFNEAVAPPEAAQETEPQDGSDPQGRARRAAAARKDRA